jgi:hypothetical protein
VNNYCPKKERLWIQEKAVSKNCEDVVVETKKEIRSNGRTSRKVAWCILVSAKATGTRRNHTDTG